MPNFSVSILLRGNGVAQRSERELGVLWNKDVSILLRGNGVAQRSCSDAARWSSL